ncbi:hypothetical protein [Marinomonas alcarazii]|uniref:hypothetical protein n=1 Tax=Marinomonas alcarazii TaxID=491949 RepID=UPI001C64ACC7|nr:hypothetical protein [Marinomonas alcarazii]
MLVLLGSNYQRLEVKGNPRLDTLELIAKDLNSDIMLIPKEKLTAVLAVLERDDQKSYRMIHGKDY